MSHLGLVDPRGLAVLLLDAVALAIIVLRPANRNYDDSDRGAGQIVLMEPPLRPSYKRCGSFMAIALLGSVAIIGLKSPSLIGAYHSAVTQLMLSVIHDPDLVNGYAQTLPPVFQISVLAFGVAFALTFRASLARRLMILVNVVIYLCVSAVVDALFGVFVVTTGLPLGPTPVLNVLIQHLVAGLVMFRIAFTSFQLPRKTEEPCLRKGDGLDNLIVIVCVVAAVTVMAAAATWLSQRFGNSPFVAAAIGFACPPYLIALITVFLGAIRLARPRRINPGPERPPIEVIIPAFNEELNIADLFRSIDDAAGRYGGPVHIILCDDGSTDRTVALAEETIANFSHATGRVVLGTHQGKSGALNTALAECRAEYVFRVDADCLVGPDAFLYSVPYFLADPRVGLVGAFTLPKEPYATWIDRLRMFELILLSGFSRPATDVVDGVVCIPGTYTGFRRQLAVDVGGFVEGMYGEDVEFTFSITRLGYRAVVDGRVLSYEDVPYTQHGLRSQRTRWCRGGIMAYSRFIPFVTGRGGPRFWFFATEQVSWRFLTPLRLTSYAYLLADALVHPSVRVNLARVGVILLLRAVPQLFVVGFWTVYYGKVRELVYLPLWYVFVFLKSYYRLEGFMSFNARPVVTSRIADALRPNLRPTIVLDSTERS